MFLTSDTTTTFSLVTTSSPDPVSQFTRCLAVGATRTFSDGGSQFAIGFRVFGHLLRLSLGQWGSPFLDRDGVMPTSTPALQPWATAL